MLNKYSLACGLVVAFLIASFASCGKTGDIGKITKPEWLGIPSATKYVLELLNDGTNWALNKNQVNITKTGNAVPTADGFIAGFLIHVTNGTNSFETTANKVPCDKDGIPTEESITKLREAVEDIKSKIRRLQN